MEPQNKKIYTESLILIYRPIFTVSAAMFVGKQIALNSNKSFGEIQRRGWAKVATSFFVPDRIFLDVPYTTWATFSTTALASTL